MNEMLRKRIERHLENLTDEQGYQVLDFVEFLESKYGTATRPPSTFERFTEGVEDSLRAGRIPGVAIRETMQAVDSASRLMQRLSEAGRGAVEELGRSLATSETKTPPDASETPPDAGTTAPADLASATPEDAAPEPPPPA